MILALAAIVIGYTQISNEVEGNWKAPITFFTLSITLLLLTAWLLLLSGFRIKTRLVLFAAELFLITGATLFVKHTLKMQGSFSGSGVPRLVWKWTPDLDAGLKPLSSDGDLVVEKVDLTTTTPQDFPEFLGPGRRNHLTGVGLASDWSGAHAPRELWRQPIGLGWGSFAVVNGFAVTQEQRGDRELVTCLEAKTGRVRWQHANAARFSEGMGGDGPRATPTIRDGRVYVMGATGILECLDGATGHAIWSRNILTDTHVANLTWGKSCSPLVYDDVVVVSGGNGPPSLAAYDRQTGLPRWTGGADKASYSSPARTEMGGKAQVLILNAGSVTGHDAANGTVLWTYLWPGDWPKAAQVVPLPDNRIFISSGYGLGCVMLAVTGGSDGKPLAIAPDWKSQHMKTEFTNVAVHNGFIYGLDDRLLACIDPANGKRRWRDGDYGHGQVLLVDDLIIVQAEGGTIALVAAKPDGFNELGSLTAFTSKSWNNPALSGHLLLVRNDREAIAYELP